MQQLDQRVDENGVHAHPASTAGLSRLRGPLGGGGAALATTETAPSTRGTALPTTETTRSAILAAGLELGSARGVLVGG